MCFCITGLLLGGFFLFLYPLTYPLIFYILKLRAALGIYSHLLELQSLIQLKHSSETKNLIQVPMEQFMDHQQDNPQLNLNDEKESYENDLQVIESLLSLPVIEHGIIHPLESIFHDTSITYWDIRNEALKEGELFNQALEYQKILYPAMKKTARKVKGNYCDCCGISESDLKQKGNKSLMKCSRCNVTWYCTKQCQKQHWRAGHKHKCKPIS